MTTWMMFRRGLTKGFSVQTGKTSSTSQTSARRTGRKNGRND
jgi:hypothetical protein